LLHVMNCVIENYLHFTKRTYLIISCQSYTISVATIWRWYESTYSSCARRSSRITFVGKECWQNMKITSEVIPNLQVCTTNWKKYSICT
jgi:hypothetical protein